MNYTYKQIWLINFPVMMSILMEQLINITDAIFLGPKDGVLKKTFDIAHYSWWRTKDFNVLQAKIV